LSPGWGQTGAGNSKSRPVAEFSFIAFYPSHRPGVCQSSCQKLSFPSCGYLNPVAIHHYLAFLDDNAIATARWRETESGIKLERFAVLPQFRNRGVGARLLKTVLQDVAGSGKTIYLHSQLRAVPFYERNGFHKIGPQFSEAQIAHFKMQYTGQ
jgi:GNAT superfamily N-acetyltransferase